MGGERRPMRKLVFLVASLFVSLAVVGTAAAKHTLEANGTAESTSFVVNSFQIVDGTAYSTVTRTGVIQGTIVGQYEQHLNATQACCGPTGPFGPISITGGGTVVGSVAECGSGTLYIAVTATFVPGVGGEVHIFLDPAHKDDNKVLKDLDLHVTGGLTGTASYTGTYTCKGSETSNTG
jgi:hypothetical protein